MNLNNNIDNSAVLQNNATVEVSFNNQNNNNNGKNTNNNKQKTISK